MSKATEFNNDNFEQEVLTSSQPVLVDFWAAWCGPCRLVSPVIDTLAEKVEGQAKVGKLNVDESPELAAKFNISSIPTVLVFRDGEVVDRLVGVQSEQVYASALESVAV